MRGATSTVVVWIMKYGSPGYLLAALLSAPAIFSWAPESLQSVLFAALTAVGAVYCAVWTVYTRVYQDVALEHNFKYPPDMRRFRPRSIDSQYRGASGGDSQALKTLVTVEGLHHRQKTMVIWSLILALASVNLLMTGR